MIYVGERVPTVYDAGEEVKTLADDAKVLSNVVEGAGMSVVTATEYSELVTPVGAASSMRIYSKVSCALLREQLRSAQRLEQAGHIRMVWLRRVDRMLRLSPE